MYQDIYLYTKDDKQKGLLIYLFPLWSWLYYYKHVILIKFQYQVHLIIFQMMDTLVIYRDFINLEGN